MTDPAAAMREHRPNILLIVTDQQRADTIAWLGNRAIHTPTLDRLAREGVCFDRTYTPAPVCVAARCAMLTGLPPHVTGCVDNGGMPLDTPSLMERLADRGYVCHGVGKMHFSPHGLRPWGFASRAISEEEPGPHDDYVAFLRQHGFGHVLDPHGLRSEFYYVPQPSQVPLALHHTRWVTDQAIARLRGHDGSQPQFLMVSYIKPHPPFESPEPWSRLYRSSNMAGPYRPVGQERSWTYWNRVQNRYKYADAGYDRRLAQLRQAAYYGCISLIDHEIGRLLEAIGSRLDDSLIIFTSDHGEMLGDYGCVGKRSMHEASARVPMLLRLPGRFEGGRRISTAASLLDVLPTCLAVAGDPHPNVHPDGDDLANWTGRHDAERVVFSQYQQGRYGLYAASDGRHKLVYSAADHREWLFRVGGVGDAAHRLRDEPCHDGEIRASLRKAMVARFVRDRYPHVVDRHGRWIDFEPPTMPADPDDGLLLQDPPALETALRAIETKGYPYRPPTAAAQPYRLLQTPDPFRRRASAPSRPRPHPVVGPNVAALTQTV